MERLLIVALVGALAQLIDGALGMGYGVTASTLLIATGATAASASATVHVGKIGSGLASGAAHWRFGNVSWRIVGWVAIPGAIGGFGGALLLTSFDGKKMTPITGSILLVLGAYMLIRFLAGVRIRPIPEGAIRGRFLVPLGLVGGVVDAIGGGGWGPVTTPALLTMGKMEPRRAIGSANAAEFFVAVAISLGFLINRHAAPLDLYAVVGLLIGGVVVAPVAAWVVRRLPTQTMGAGVGATLVVTNLRTLLVALGVGEGLRTPVLLGAALLGVLAVARVHRRERPAHVVASLPIDGTAPASSPR